MGATVYSYDASSNRLTSASGVEPATYAYDLNGNTIADAAGLYTHTPVNQMETATVGGDLTAYRYDADDLRKVKVRAGEVRYYIHGPGGQILSEFVEQGGQPELVRDYVYAGSRLLASIKPVVLSVHPSSVVFGAVLSGPEPALQSALVELTGSPGAAWTATASSAGGWLSVLDAAGTSPGSLRLRADPTGLEIGSYPATVTVKSNGAAGSPKTIAVTLVVSGTPELVAVPVGISFFMTSGGSTPATQSLLVTYTGEAPVAWTAASGAPWLSLAPPSGDTPGMVTLSVTGAGLAKGTYTDTVVVEAPGVPDSARSITVALVVESPGGEACDPEAWYCEPFDALDPGDLDGQGGWARIGNNATGQVQADPRGPGRALVLEAPDGGFVKDSLALTPHLIDGSEFSVQVMTRDVSPGSKSVAKIQFLTSPGDGWAKNHATFATIRAGARMVFQYGETISQDLMPMQSGRWYEVRLSCEGGQVHVYVDGHLKFSTESEIAASLTFQGYANTAWPFPGLAGFDRLQAKSPAPTSFVVEPGSLYFSAGEGGTCQAPPPGFAAPAVLGAPARSSEGSAPGLATRSTGRVGANLPLAFEPNLGQAGRPTAFVARGPGYSLMLDPTKVRLTLTKAGAANDLEANDSKGPQKPAGLVAGVRSDVRLTLVGTGTPTMEGADLLPGRSHYLRSPAAGGRVADVPNYRSVRYREVYPGIDLVFRGDQGRLEYDWIVAPGAEPSRIAMGLEGARSVAEEPGGALVLTTDAGPLRMERPHIFQDTEAGQREIKGAFVRLDDERIGFSVEAYDKTATLVIDPVLTYSTYFNVSGSASRVALDGSGNIYVGGVAPALADRPPGTAVGQQGDYDLAVTKLDSAGTTRLFTTYIGGSGNESLADLVVSGGQILVAGYTNSTDFPTLTSVLPNYGGGAYDGFVLELDAGDGNLVYSTYLGGVGDDYVNGLAVDSQGAAYLVGVTGSTNFPIQAFSPEQPVFQPALKVTPFAAYDAFVTKLSPEGSLEYSTFYGGSWGDNAGAVAVDAEGNAYFSGSTSSKDLPVVHVIKDYSSGFNHVPFAAKLNPFGSGLVYSSWVAYVYGPGIPMAMALDTSGAAYIVGSTDASYFPSTPGAFQETFQGYGWDGFAMKVNPSGTGIEWSTFLGASSSDFAETVALGPAGQVYVGGYTFSADFPLPGCFQAWGGGGGGWVVSLTPDGSALAFGTMLGGGVADLAVAPSGALYVVGSASPNMPTVDPLSDTGVGSFIARIDPTTPFAGASTIYLEADSRGVEVNETAGVANLTVRRLCSASGAASVSYRAESGTAVSGVNFAPTMGTLVFGAGDATPQTIQVPILDDQKLTCEEPLTFDLTLDPVSLSGSAWLGNARASIRIKDDTTVTVLKATFEIKDAQGGVGPAWEATTDVPWLSLDQTSGFGPSTVKVYVDISGLSVGEYTGQVMVTAPGSPNPHIVALVVSILPANGYSPGLAQRDARPGSGSGVRR